MAGAAIKRYTLNKINTFSVPTPPINLQNQFAERLLAIEVQKLLALASLEKSAALFNSLLQLAFKGELTT
jgi:type I restriction enzyme S subunit